MQTLDRIIQAVSDGYRHEVSEIAEKVGLNGKKLNACLEFLGKYDFLDLSKGSVKLSDLTMKFLKDKRDS